MTISRVDLEDFDDGSTRTPSQSLEYKRGFEDGEQTARDAEIAKLSSAIEAISTALSDMKFGYTEARIMLLDHMRPLLSQVAETVLPRIAQESFAAHLVDVLIKDFEKVTSNPVQICVHPSTVDHLTDALSGQAEHFIFTGDAKLNDGQAVLRNSDAHIMIDLPSLTLELQAALNGLEPFERTLSNG